MLFGVADTCFTSLQGQARLVQTMKEQDAAMFLVLDALAGHISLAGHVKLKIVATMLPACKVNSMLNVWAPYSIFMGEGSMHSLTIAAMHPKCINCINYMDRLCQGADVVSASNLMGRSQDLSDYILRCS